jgi:hypothetical protein
MPPDYGTQLLALTNGDAKVLILLFVMPVLTMVAGTLLLNLWDDGWRFSLRSILKLTLWVAIISALIGALVRY